MLGEVLALLDLGDPQIQIHGGAAANRVRAIRGGGAGGLGGAVEGGGNPLLAIGASSIAAGRRAARGERGAGEGAGGEVVICAWFFGWLAGVDERLGWLAHSLVLAAARGDGASSSVSIFFWDWMELCLGTKRQARNVSKNLTF